MSELTLDDMIYKPFGAEELVAFSKMYGLRQSKVCDIVPLSTYVYKDFYNVDYWADDNALLLRFKSDDGEMFGFLPYCAPQDIGRYFKLQEQYFNKNLGRIYEVASADEEGVRLLQEAGALEGYDVREEKDLRDYIYDGESLRTLSGRKLSKKRNHIHKFDQMYEGRWEYRSLRFEEKDEILRFLEDWMKNKLAEGEGGGINEKGETFDAILELEAEHNGIRDLINERVLYDFVRMGAIYIDGKLEAFSVGAWYPELKMAIIDIEKANDSIPGIYQVINQQFMIHEFPDAELVNREDDVGLEGLRKAKLSYFPIDYANKYFLTQKTLG